VNALYFINHIVAVMIRMLILIAIYRGFESNQRLSNWYLLFLRIKGFIRAKTNWLNHYSNNMVNEIERIHNNVYVQNTTLLVGFFIAQAQWSSGRTHYHYSGLNRLCFYRFDSNPRSFAIEASILRITPAIWLMKLNTFSQ
jgi:hypothetical protein